MASVADLALVFQLGTEQFALPAADVLMVVEMGPLAPLPRLPPAIRGITHHRGHIVTVIDTSILLGGTPTPLDAQSRLVLLERGGHATGLLTGKVRGLTSLPSGEGSPPARTGGAVVRIHLHQGQVINVLGTNPVLDRVQDLCCAEASRLQGAPSAAAAVPVN